MKSERIAEGALRRMVEPISEEEPDSAQSAREAEEGRRQKTKPKTPKPKRRPVQ